MLIAAVMLYRREQESWLKFALLFLAPDISIAAYLARKRIGAAVYNLVHSYTLPLLLAATGVALPLALIWIAHIGFDRLLGFGLKFPDAFQPTHIQSAARFGGP